MLDENNRSANQLLSDFMKVHNRLAREKKAAHTGKQPKRKTPPVHVWRAEENDNGKSNDNQNRLREAIFGR
jgi:hypothetical protein